MLFIRFGLGATGGVWVSFLRLLEESLRTMPEVESFLSSMLGEEFSLGRVEANLLPVFRSGTAPGLKPKGNMPPEDWGAGGGREAGGCSALGLGIVSAFFIPPIGGGGGGGGGAPVGEGCACVCVCVPGDGIRRLYTCTLSMILCNFNVLMFNVVYFRRRRISTKKFPV